MSRALSLFDLQVNGFAGVDFQRADITKSELHRASDEIDALCRKCECIEKLRACDPVIAETICGYHLEGPWLSREEGFVGAHRAEVQRAPSLVEFRKIQDAANGSVRLVTLAPEWPGSPEFISVLSQSGIVISLGHTNANERQIDDAIRAGATLCTHLGNGVPQTLARHGNVVQRLLARDELTACFIPDGVHLPPFVLKNFFRAKPVGKAVFTTDAMAAAAAPPGRYKLGSIEVESRDGAVRQPGRPNLAGSCLTPDRGVENAARILDIPVADARAFFSNRVAELFGIELPQIEIP
jgi:N-acetylglucosamine-6-phosphate deacetylase